MIDPTSLTSLGFLAFLAPVILFWNQTKSIAYKCFSFFVRTDNIEPPILARNLIDELFSKNKHFTWGNKSYSFWTNDYIKSIGHNADIFLLKRSFFVVFYRKIFPIIISAKSQSGGIKVTYLFFTINIRKILERICSRIYSSDTYKVSKFYVNEAYGKDIRPDEISLSKQNINESSAPAGYSLEAQYIDPYVLNKHSEYLFTNYSDIGFSKESKKELYYWQKEGIHLRNSIKHWLDKRGWFYDRGITYRRGCLLYGKPGTGKTKMILESAKYLDIPIMKANISNMSEREFSDLYYKLDNPSILLIEDIDVIFNLRENLLAKNNRTKSLISFDSLINIIGGAKQKDGIYIIITTNKFDSIDPSLLRAGRLDLKIEVGNLDEDGRHYIAKNVLRDFTAGEIDEIVDRYQEITAAEFENKCIEMAVDRFYNNGKTD